MDKFKMVQKFQRAMDQAEPDSPTMLERKDDIQFVIIGLSAWVSRMKLDSKAGKGGRTLARASWILEELVEFMEAETIEDQADALTDLNYFVNGTFVEMGLHPDPIFEIVHNANMSKLWEDGKPRFDEQGKIIKPPTWKAPEPQIKAEIHWQIESNKMPWE